MKRFAILIIAATILLAPLGTVGTARAQATFANTAGTKIYASLGDSMAAGLGLPLVSNPTPSDTFCGRSSQAYNVAVAKAANLPLVSAACSGAKVGDLFTKQAVSGPNIPSQLKTVYAAGTPQLITITAGANDAHWADFIRACYSFNCASQGYTNAANTYLYFLRSKLYIAFAAIDVKSAGHPPTTIVTGYYNPVSANCAAIQTNVTPAELTWISNETTALNRTIADVASHYSFVKYVPVDFTGHDICSSNSWVQGLTDPAPFHPTAAGQNAIGNAVISRL